MSKAMKFYCEKCGKQVGFAHWTDEDHFLCDDCVRLHKYDKEIQHSLEFPPRNYRGINGFKLFYEKMKEIHLGGK